MQARWTLRALPIVALAAAAATAWLWPRDTTAQPESAATAPAALAFADDLADDAGATATSTTGAGSDDRRAAHGAAPVSERVPVELGTPEQPFAPLPIADQATAVVSPSGVVLPVVSERNHNGEVSWVVATPCADVQLVSGLAPLARAHVVLDPGHGGREVGAVGPSGLTEKDLNLAVALAARDRLEAAGATVILTRTTDIAMTTVTRALLARTVDPALFVSIHHNGGAPANGDRPGTIVFTKSNSEPSTRFGGLFHRSLTTRLAVVAEAQRAAFDAYAETFVAHQSAVAAYDRSLAARDAALVANGQIDPATTTSIPDHPDDPRSLIDGSEVPDVREVVTTTTMPPVDAASTVPVPDTAPLPPPLEIERVAEFRWAGSGNAGVRSWRGDDGRDILSVLRRSGDVPAALVEFLYVTNPVEEALLADPAFIELEAEALVEAIVAHLSTGEEGDGFVADQVGDQDIGGGGRPSDCVEPDLGLGETPGDDLGQR